MGWQDTLIIESFSWLRSLFSKGVSYSEVNSIVKDKIVPITGCHRVSILKFENGKSSLGGDEDMFMSVVYVHEDTNYLKAVPTNITRVKLDYDLAALARRVINEKIVRMKVDESREGTQLYAGMVSGGVKYMECYLLKKGKKSCYVLILSTALTDNKPFNNNNWGIDIELSRLQRIYKNK